VNGDGFDDLTSSFRISEAGLASGDTEACVTGETVGGIAFAGCDLVVILRGCGFGFELALVVPLLSWLRRKRRSMPYQGGGHDAVRSLRRDAHDSDPHRWLHARLFCLSRLEVERRKAPSNPPPKLPTAGF
jgi:hypothetical protein